MRRSLLLAATLLVSLLPSVPAFAEPRIELLNPSGLTATQIPELSDTGDRPVHLVAWVQQVPLVPQVEFEIQPPGGPLPGQTPTTLDGTRIGSTDTWEAFFSIPPSNSFVEGQYTVVARLFSNLDQVAEAMQIVTVNKEDVPPPAENVEITYPDNGAPFGFYTPAKRGIAVLKVAATAGTDQVQAFYSLTDAGTDPEWTPCGAGRPDAGVALVRCTLREEDPASAVTAVAAVANNTPPPGEPQRAGDDAGDAHRVFPYAQRPAQVFFDPESATVEVAKCALFTATIVDQQGNTITGINADAHAEGPTDQLRFATFDDTPVTTKTTAYQAPDKAHVSRELTPRCSDQTNTDKDQGDHNLIGQSDRKHIETAAGTNNNGQFVVSLISGVSGGTTLIVWAEEDDDDVQLSSEASGGSRIGWGENPPPPKRELFLDPTTSTATTGDCQSLTLTAKESGSPLSGVNVDVHASGPDAGVAFCVPATGASVARDPDQGSHVGGADDEDTRHLEGETDSGGRFVFGVTSPSEGTTDIVAWLDSVDDDAQGTDEVSRGAQVSWATSGERTISIESNKSRVPSGRKVRFLGSIEARSGTCESSQIVRLQSKPRRGGSFRTISSTSTDEDGNYSVNVTVRKTKKYRAVAPLAGVCEKATSRTITVRAT